MPVDDLNFQNISTVQSGLQPKPVNVTAAAAISPTTFLTIVTGTTGIATINPPVSGSHLLAIVTVTTNFSGFVTSGNILAASVTNSTVWDNKVSLFVFNPLTNKYHPSYPVAGTNF
jgi:hypothetical protein